MCGPATGRHPSPSSGSTRHELRSAVEKGYAVLGCRPQRRVTGPLSAERTIKRLSPAIPSSEPYFSGCYRQHRACRSKNQAETARGCGCSPAQISIAHRRCPRFPSSGAFRSRPGSRRPAHIHRPPSKPITLADHRAIGWRSLIEGRAGVNQRQSEPLSAIVLTHRELWQHVPFSGSILRGGQMAAPSPNILKGRKGPIHIIPRVRWGLYKAKCLRLKVAGRSGPSLTQQGVTPGFRANAIGRVDTSKSRRFETVCWPLSKPVRRELRPDVTPLAASYVMRRRGLGQPDHAAYVGDDV